MNRTPTNLAYEILQEHPEYSFEQAMDLARKQMKVTERMARKPKASAPKRPKVMDELEAWLESGAWGRVEREYRFHPERKWRADYALVDQTPIVLIEYDGLMHQGENQSHASINGILRDSEKMNHAQALGFRVFRANAKTLATGDFYTVLASALTEMTTGD